MSEAGRSVDTMRQRAWAHEMAREQARESVDSALTPARGGTRASRTQGAFLAASHRTGGGPGGEEVSSEVSSGTVTQDRPRSRGAGRERREAGAGWDALGLGAAHFS